MADLTIREAYDLLRSFHAKQVKPFEKMPQALETAIQVIEHDLPTAQTALADLTAQLTRLRASKPEVEAEVSAAQARVQTALDAAATAERVSGEKIRAAEQLANSRETELVRGFEFKGATLQREFEAKRDELAAEITGLEAKKAALDQAIAAVRAKF